MLNDLTSYSMSGSRWYGHWHGLPCHRKSLGPVFNWLKYLFLGASTINIAELHPSGGIWTHTILDLLKRSCVPTQLTYSLLGHDVEHLLTYRDALRVFDRYVKWDKPCRVRKYPVDEVPSGYDPILISECLFNKRQPSDFPTELDAVVSFDFLQCLAKRERYDTYRRISKSLKSGAVFIGNCSFHERELDLTFLQEHGFTLDPRCAIDRGFYYFKGMKE